MTSEPEDESSMSRGKPLPRQAREIVYNVVHYFYSKREEDKKKGDLRRYNIRNLIGQVTGVSPKTVSNIIKEAVAPENDPLEKPSFKTPSKSKSRKSRIDRSLFKDATIRKKILELYAKKQVPTIKALRIALQEDGEQVCSGEYLRTRVLGCGFKWRRCQRRKLLIERPEIAAWRAKYLRDLNSLRSKSNNIVYIGEMCIKGPSLSELEEKSTAKRKSSDQLVIVHGGGEFGFVDNALLICSSSSTEDHSLLDPNAFSKWVDKTLLPNLPAGSVVVMDNAKYHCEETNKKPNSTSTRDDIVDWLRKNYVDFDEQMTKAGLLILAKNFPLEKRYTVDDMIAARGHQVLRIPPFHSDLNPIEMVWSDIKSKFTSDSAKSSLPATDVLRRLFGAYSAENWKNACAQVEVVEDFYRKREHAVDEGVDEALESLSGGCYSDSSDGDCSSDTD